MDQQNNLPEDIRSYVSLKGDILKLKLAKGLSVSISAVLAGLLIISVLQLVLIALTVTIVLAAGALLGNYLAGALIALGLFIITLAVLMVCRRKLFTGTMIRTFVKLLFPENNED